MEKIKFEKYSSIENHYMTGTVERFYREHPELETEVMFQLTEKLDGSNVVLSITKDSFKYGKRTSWVGEEESFNDIHNVMKKDHIVKFVEAVQREIYDETVVTFYGEIYGEGIQKRIKYCNGKDVKLFEMKINGEWSSPQSMVDFLEIIGCEEMHVPIIGYVKGLKACLEYDTHFDTKLFEEDDTHKEAQECEGVVIKPFIHTYFMNNGKKLTIKKKNEKFAEKMGVKVKKPKEYTESQKEFMEYINENRLLSVISQHGKPVDPSDIGKYIGLLTEDALTDYMKDHDLEELSKSEKKLLKSVVGKLANPLIKAQF